MYINNEDFEKWMQKLSKKLSEIGQDLKSLINTDKVFSRGRETTRQSRFSLSFESIQTHFATLSVRRKATLLYDRS